MNKRGKKAYVPNPSKLHEPFGGREMKTIRKKKKEKKRKKIERHRRDSNPGSRRNCMAMYAEKLYNGSSATY